MSFQKTKVDAALGQKVQAHLEKIGLATPTTDLLNEHASAKIEKIEDNLVEVWKTLGMDLSDDSLIETPKRIAKMMVLENYWGLLPENFPKCTTIENKSENQQGVIEKNDAKSMVMDAFNKAYLDNDMTGQDSIFVENAVARVNGQEMSPAEMIEAFMGGREFYNDIKNINPSTSTFIYDDGAIYTSTWFTWEGISKSTGVTVNNPVHAYFRWEGDKVSRVAYIFDSAEYVANME